MTNEEKAKRIALDKQSGKASGYIDTYLTAYESAMAMAEWKDEQFWLYQNIEQIIKTYKSFPDRSCPSELVKKTIEKLKPQK